MRFKVRHLREISRILPRYFHSVHLSSSSLGTLNQLSRQGIFSPAPFVIPLSHVWVKSSQSIIKRWFHVHGFSKMSETPQEFPSEVDFLTFFESTLDEPEGPYHCWLNKLEESKDPFNRKGAFLVLADVFLEDSLILDSDRVLMFERVKLLQRKYPQLHIFGFQSCNSICSVASQTHVVQTIMKEYITFPILLSNKKFSEITNLACYLLFKHFRSPLLYYEKRTEFQIIIKAIEELNSLQNENFATVQNLNDTGIKHPDVIKEPCCFFLRNLLLYFPGCISVDEIGNRLFLSDSNHHRIIIFDCDGKILDCIGSSPGFEDGEFELAKLLRPAASFYHAPEDCLYFVDSENHAIRRAHLGRRDLETIYPTCNTDKKFSGIWSWILDKLGMGREVVSKSEEFDLDSLIFPWHLMKSRENNLLIINRSFQTLWIIDSASGKIKETVTGYPKIIENCGKMITEKVSLLRQIFGNQLKHSVDPNCSLGLTHTSMMSSLATFQNDIIFCDTVGQTILKLNKESGVISNFHFSNFGVLGLPYWFPSPLERVFAGANAYHVQHLQCFSVLPGRCDIQVNVDIPKDTELAAPLQEGCIWRQTRGSAAEVTGSEEVDPSTEKVGVAQQWFDELDNLAFSSPGSEASLQDETKNPDRNFHKEDKVNISCAVNISPGTSEVFIDAVLYLKLKRNLNSFGNGLEEKATRILDIMNEKGGRDAACIGLMLESSRDMEDLIFMKPLHLRVRLECLDQPTPVASKDIVLTDSTIDVNVSL